MATLITNDGPRLITATPEPLAKKQKLSPLGSLTAGAIAGGIEASITYPFEWAKTRSQLPSNAGSVESKNPVRLLYQTISRQGAASVYAGCGALVAGTALKAGVRFLTFDTTQALLADGDGKLTAQRRVLAGMTAGTVEAILAVTPTERIKTAMIDDARGAKRFTSATQATSAIIREQGIQGLYRGLTSTIIKQSATSAVRMGIYSTLKETYAQRTGSKPDTILVSFAMGAVAGTGTVYATQPFDTIKTRAQSARGERITSAIANVMREHGVRGFWKQYASGPIGALRRHRLLRVRTNRQCAPGTDVRRRDSDAARI
ncbi:CtIP-related endonuclease [Elasticomyces elasticus]|nr:CtIP-related endonuclease [Elasticomyces elasticus]KAK3645040.1 CtIP-related endonuclease [Elasticomyces elasticus]KAK4907196.1 CtIP-related endonuclease [Elasticomyces elasticus]KAK5747580.1 CtIP-related endonuclease [Elasticomyces elasticus]